jgi:hypothetical protein
MKYTKTALSFGEQAELLLGRGLEADRDELIERLRAVNYYRLSAYWYTFRIPGDPADRLRPGTSLDTVWRRYAFDRHLRLLVMDAIERIEIALRTEVVNRFTMQHGPFDYLTTAADVSMPIPRFLEIRESLPPESGMYPSSEASHRQIWSLTPNGTTKKMVTTKNTRPHLGFKLQVPVALHGFHEARQGCLQSFATYSIRCFP